MAHRYGRRQPNLIESTTLWASRANRSNEAAGASIETSTGKPPRLRAWIRTRLPRMTVNGAAGPEDACAPGFSFPGIPNSAAIPTKAGALMQPFGTLQRSRRCGSPAGRQHWLMIGAAHAGRGTRIDTGPCPAEPAALHGFRVRTSARPATLDDASRCREIRQTAARCPAPRELPDPARYGDREPPCLGSPAASNSSQREP